MAKTRAALILWQVGRVLVEFKARTCLGLRLLYDEILHLELLGRLDFLGLGLEYLVLHLRVLLLMLGIYLNAFKIQLFNLKCLPGYLPGPLLLSRRSHLVNYRLIRLSAEVRIGVMVVLHLLGFWVVALTVRVTLTEVLVAFGVQEPHALALVRAISPIVILDEAVDQGHVLCSKLVLLHLQRLSVRRPNPARCDALLVFG